MKYSSNMSLLLTSSTLLLFIFIFHKLFTKFIPPSIMSNYVTPISSHFTWAFDFLLQFSLFPNLPEINVHENGDYHQGPSIRLYEPELGSNEAVDCAVCLCKIEEGEEIRELRCSHMFHRECLDRWVGHRNNNNGTCPLCRGSIAPSRMVNELGEELIVFRFPPFSPGNRSTWWLR